LCRFLGRWRGASCDGSALARVREAPKHEIAGCRAQVVPPVLWGFEPGAGAVATGLGASRRCCEAGSMTRLRIRDGLFGLSRAIGSGEQQNTSAAGRALFLPDGADRFLEAML
jgi:hypothetical protein